MIDWVPLFEDMGIPWRNTGKNTSKRNINICCPLCADDYGFHLACSLGKPVYYCYREPQAHSGPNLTKLLVALGADYVDAQKLLKRYSGDSSYIVEQRKESTDQERRWDAIFEPITEASTWSPFDYMQMRGFPNALEVADRYDLRQARVGKWARRLALPVVEDGSVVGWTARDIDGYRTPKYMTDQSVHMGMVYAPRLPRAKAIIVEGPLDALKISAAQQEWSGVSLMGKNLSPRKIARLHKLLRKCERILFLPDSDVGVARYAMFDELNMISPTRLQITAIPGPYKDAGEMSYAAVRHWLGEYA